MHRAIAVIITAVALSAFTLPAQAGADEARAAYDAGDYARAFREWRLLAEQGDPQGQGNFGVMYAKGEGVAQDDAEAVRLKIRVEALGSARNCRKGRGQSALALA